MIRNNELITQKKFNKISIGLASPEVVLANSRGEVLKPETINYRTHKPDIKESFVIDVALRLRKKK